MGPLPILHPNLNNRHAYEPSDYASYWLSDFDRATRRAEVAKSLRALILRQRTAFFGPMPTR